MNELTIELEAILSGHQNPIYTVENGPRANMLFTAGNDKGVVLWDLDTMTFKSILMAVESSVYALHYIAELSCLAIGEQSGKVTLYDFTKDQVVATLTGHQKPIFDIKSLPSKGEIILASEDGSVSIWCSKNFNKIHQFQLSTSTVRNIAVSPNGKQLAFGAKDARIFIVDAQDYTLVKEINQHSLPITSLCFSPDGRYLLSGGRDAKLNIFNTEDFSLKEQIIAHMFTIYGIAYHPEFPVFVTASRDKSLKFWDAETFKLIRTVSFEKGYDAHKLSINKIVWNLNKNQLVSVGDEKLALVWNVKP